MGIKRTKIDEYRARAGRWVRRAEKTHNQVDREWQMMFARAYLMLAEAEAERPAPLAEGIIPLGEAAA